MGGLPLSIPNFRKEAGLFNMSEWENLLRLAERNGVRLNEGFRTVPRRYTRSAQTMTESNTNSDIGPNSPNRSAQASVKAYEHNQVRKLVARETPRERMTRVVRSVRKRRKKHG